MRLEEIVKKHVAINILKYGKPSEKAIIGKVIAECPEAKQRIKDVIELIRKTIDEVNKLSKEDKEKFLSQYKAETEKETKKKEIKLPPLDKAEQGKVVMRFAPNPNGPPTLGSARGIIINHEYARMYKGKFILRFDDTDPRTKRPLLEAYDWYIEDCKWLGAKPDEVYYASKRIHIYYKYIEKLLEMEKAYPCFCSKEQFKKYRDSGVECPHRNTSKEDSLEIWEKMLEGSYDEGEVVIRIKTDMKHKDPAIRDWVAFRIIYESHPLVGDKYHVYPTLDFESAIEDHLLGITHIIRGKDLADSEKRQKYIYKYFGWEYPVTKHWGKLTVYEFGKMSTSSIKKAIDQGLYSGWDDPRLPTIRALRRRGFRPESIRNLILSLGVDESDVSISMKNLYAENKKIIERDANRYFFVWDPIKIKIKDVATKEVKIPLNPHKGGIRILKGDKEVYVSKDDFEKLKGKTVRLKEFCTVKLDYESELISYDLVDVKKGKNIIHWLSPSDSINCIVIGQDKNYEGIVEKSVVNEIGRVVQFERFGFCRIESVENDTVKAIFTHP